ncbi:hypothetical protein NUM3379_07410 [Kineococcus sp. NUM-3379]
MHLLIISSARDDSVRTLVPKLHERGVPFTWWDEADYPATSTLTTRFTGGRHRQVLRGDGWSLDLGTVTTVWHRRPGRPSSPGVADAGQRAYAEFVAQRVLEGAYDLMTGARWMPAPPQHARRVDNKLLHLRTAADLGLRIPETLVGNDPEALVELWGEFPGGCITKNPEVHPFEVEGEARHSYTTRVHRRHLAGRHRLRHAPVIAQPNLVKAYEVRATVVGERVLGARIDSQGSRLTAQDWRHYDDHGVRYEPLELPADVAARVVALVRALGLTFATVDLVADGAGGFTFLDLNVNGQWAFVEMLCGLPIGDAIADWLALDPASRTPEETDEHHRPRPCAVPA